MLTNEKWLFRVWLAALGCLIVAATILLTAFTVGEAFRGSSSLSPGRAQFVLSVANYPTILRQAVRDLKGHLRSEPTSLLVNRSAVERPSWIRRFPSSEDSGFLLFAGLDGAAKRTVVRLVRIADGVDVARWEPDWALVHARSTPKQWGSKFAVSELLPSAPLLLDDGSIIFNTGNAVVRSAACQPEPLWVLDHIGHHSVEKALDDSVWVPSVVSTPYSDDPRLQQALRIDGLSRISFDGRLLEERSMADILESNGLRALLIGLTSVNMRSDDLVHLNQISVAHSSGRYWQEGDLLLSSRHLSTVFLYRPATNRIIWYRTGPWMNQHSARFIDDHRISVLDNHSFRSADGGGFVRADDVNHVVVYDFDTGTWSEPFESLLQVARPRTISEGVAQVLPDGGLFLEETDQRRLMRFASDRLLWSYVNDYDATRLGALSWSRYLTAEEASRALPALAKACGSDNRARP